MRLLPIPIRQAEQGGIMKGSSLSMLVFSAYAGILSALLLFYPNFFLLLGFDEVNTPWVRILGYIVGALSFYYFMAVQEEQKSFYRWSVYARMPLFPFFVLLVVLGLAPPIMVLIGAWDTGLAIWTGAALRREKRA